MDRRYAIGATGRAREDGGLPGRNSARSSSVAAEGGNDGLASAVSACRLPTLRGIKLSRNIALFAGSEGRTEHWSFGHCETSMLGDIDPLAHLTNALTRIATGHPHRNID